MSKKEVAEWEKNVTLCKKMLHKIMKMPNAFIFSEPVDWKALELPDYPAIVKKPMDLGTIETKLTKGKYATVQNFVADVTLVWNDPKLNLTDQLLSHAVVDYWTQFATSGDPNSGVMPGAVAWRCGHPGCTEMVCAGCARVALAPAAGEPSGNNQNGSAL